MKVLRRADPDDLVGYARGIVRGDYLLADLGDRDWQHALLFMGEALASYRNLGLVLVPLAPHSRGYWLNGRVPALVFEVRLVCKGDLPKLRREVDRMNRALFPESVQSRRGEDEAP